MYLWQQVTSNCPSYTRTQSLKECASVLVPIIINIVNLSLTSGQLHPILKESVISPLLKKSTSRVGNRGFDGVLYKMWTLLASSLVVSRCQPRWRWLKL